MASAGPARALLSPARLALAAGGALALALPLWVTLPFPRHILVMVCLYGALATAWNVIGGYCGQVALGQAAFFGVGAYASSLLVRDTGLSPWLGMAAGAAVAVLLAYAIGWPVLRLRGHYFAIATIAIGEIAQTLVLNWDWAGGARGVHLPLRRPDSWVHLQFHDRRAAYYYVALGLLALALGVTRGLERSRAGYWFRAIREDEEAAASLGVDVARMKRRALALSAALTAVGGTVYAQYVLVIDPESVFPLSLSILICLIAVLGGVGTLWGPLVGAAVLVPLSELTRALLGGGGRALDLVVWGTLIVVVAVLEPRGLVGLGQRLRAARRARA